VNTALGSRSSARAAIAASLAAKADEEMETFEEGDGEEEEYCFCNTDRHLPTNTISFEGVWVCCDECEKWCHGECVRPGGLSRKQAEALESQRVNRRVTDDLVDLRAHEGAGLPPFGWRDRTRGRSYVTTTMAAVLIRAYATFRESYPDRRLSLGDLAQPGGGTLYHGTLVRELEGAEALDVLNRAQLEGEEFVARSVRLAADFPRELHRFEGPQQQVHVEETILAQRSSTPLRLRVAVRRYIESPTPDAEHATQMHRQVNSLIRRGTLLSTKSVTSWRDGRRQRQVRQHWVNPATRSQVVVLAGRKQRRTLRLKDVSEVRFSRFSARKPESFQASYRTPHGIQVSFRKRRPKLAIFIKESVGFFQIPDSRFK